MFSLGGIVEKVFGCPDAWLRWDWGVGRIWDDISCPFDTDDGVISVNTVEMYLLGNPDNDNVLDVLKFDDVEIKSDNEEMSMVADVNKDGKGEDIDRDGKVEDIDKDGKVEDVDKVVKMEDCSWWNDDFGIDEDRELDCNINWVVTDDVDADFGIDCDDRDDGVNDGLKVRVFVDDSTFTVDTEDIISEVLETDVEILDGSTVCSEENLTEDEADGNKIVELWMDSEADDDGNTTTCLATP